MPVSDVEFLINSALNKLSGRAYRVSKKELYDRMVFEYRQGHDMEVYGQYLGEGNLDALIGLMKENHYILEESDRKGTWYSLAPEGLKFRIQYNLEKNQNETLQKQVEISDRMNLITYAIAFLAIVQAAVALSDYLKCGDWGTFIIIFAALTVIWGLMVWVVKSPKVGDWTKKHFKI